MRRISLNQTSITSESLNFLFKFFKECILNKSLSDEDLSYIYGQLFLRISNFEDINVWQDEENGDTLAMFAAIHHRFNFLNFLLGTSKQNFSLANEEGENLLHVIAYEISGSNISFVLKNSVENCLLKSLSNMQVYMSPQEEYEILTSLNGEVTSLEYICKENHLNNVLAQLEPRLRVLEDASKPLESKYGDEGMEIADSVVLEETHLIGATLVDEGLS